MTERQLNKIDATLNFYKPVLNGRRDNTEIYFNISRYVRKEHNVPVKSDYCKMTISKGLLNLLETKYSDLCTKETSLKTNKPIKKYSIAFSFGGGSENYAILNPTGNIPFLNLIVRKNGANEINNHKLVNDIYKLFKVDKLHVFNFRLYLTYFATVNKLDLYRIELRDSKGKKFNSDLKIIENE